MRPRASLRTGTSPQLWTALKTLYPVSLTAEDMIEEVGGVDGLDRAQLHADLKADAHAAYDAREEALGAEVLRELERRVLLSVLDRKWREHLYEMDYLREGIGLRAYSQRDPLVEYQREGFDLFSAMMDSIKEESVGYLFNVEVTVNAEEEVLEEDVEHEHEHDHDQEHERPEYRRQGSGDAADASQVVVLGADGRRRRWHRGAGCRSRGGRVRGRFTQRSLSLWVGQEVQAMPWGPARRNA